MRRYILIFLALLCIYNYQCKQTRRIVDTSTHQVESIPTDRVRVTKHQLIKGRVVGIKDGDTIELLTSDKELHTIRLAHVDTPERKQAYGAKAKKFTSDFCYNKTAYVIIQDVDRYGRSIGVVHIADQELNLELIKAGYGWHYKKYSKSQEHATAELMARSKRLGLWKDQQAIAPWDFRKNKKK